MGIYLASWKAHLFPLSVVLPALVVGILCWAEILGIRWTLGNTIIVFLIILAGIVLECIASWKIANLRFSEPATTGKT